MGPQPLLRDARAALYLRRLVLQKDNFEPSGKGGVGMAYHGHQGAWGGKRTTDGYEGYYAMVMVESGGIWTTESILMKNNTE
jgi:hypothetical protein